MDKADRTGARGSHPLIVQFAKFAVVGAFSFSVDYGLFLLFYRALGIQYIVASTTSFSISLVLNYVLSLKYVFDKREERNVVHEFSFYVLLNVFGLGLNQIVLYVSVEKFLLSPATGKIIATVVVMVYNFFSRKVLIESPRRTRLSTSPAESARSE